MSELLASRRRFLQGALAGGALLWAEPLAVLARSARAADGFPATFRRPGELTGADITLRARLADVPVLPGRPTTMWTFDGAFPGPTIRRPSGERTTLTVHHDLPPEVDTLTIHHHGGHQAALHDGGPAAPPIAPGTALTYVYDLVEDGEPERGAMQWYHDHGHHRTGRNTWMGLLGLFMVDDGFDRLLGLPVDADDIPLVLCDRRFDADNQLIAPFTAPHREGAGPLDALGAGWPPGDEVTGDVHLVNGVHRPHLDVEARRYRLRILNASNFRVYDVGLSNGRHLAHIGTESGLLVRPVIRPSVVLGPGERAEVLVDLTGLEGRRVEVVGRPTTTTPAGTAPTPAQLMELRVGGGAPSPPPPLPVRLRPMPEWTEELSLVPDRVWVFSLGVDLAGRAAWTINGRAFDHERVDACPELGSNETWLLVNAGPVAVSHYIHIHDVDWKVLARNGRPPAPGEGGLKETFRLDPGETLLIGSRFTDHTGRFMLHCHMLEHEDHGMMATFEVVEPGRGDRLANLLPTGDPVELLVARTVEPGAVPVALDVLRSVARTGLPAPMALLDRPLPLIAGSAFCDLTKD